MKNKIIGTLFFLSISSSVIAEDLYSIKECDVSNRLKLETSEIRNASKVRVHIKHYGVREDRPYGFLSQVLGVSAFIGGIHVDYLCNPGAGDLSETGSFCYRPVRDSADNKAAFWIFVDVKNLKLSLYDTINNGEDDYNGIHVSTRTRLISCF